VTENYAEQVSLFQQRKTGAGSRIRTNDLLITNYLVAVFQTFCSSSELRQFTEGIAYDID
jgi:hypothetical protein